MLILPNVSGFAQKIVWPAQTLSPAFNVLLDLKKPPMENVLNAKAKAVLSVHRMARAAPLA
jgi:hypothetical protein